MNKTPKTIFLIAGEASGDTLGAELINSIHNQRNGKNIEFIGTGGQKMKMAGLQQLFDLTEHAVVGFWEVLKNYFKFRKMFQQLINLAIKNEPDAIVLIDYPGFNLRFARAIRNHQRKGTGAFKKWQPKIIAFVSPQIWAWKENRLKQITSDFDLMLSIFPFEKSWYAKRAPNFAVEFVGHPLVDRFSIEKSENNKTTSNPDLFTDHPEVLLLPGSRQRELEKHLPVMLDTVAIITTKLKIKVRIVLPNEKMLSLAKDIVPTGTEILLQIGNLEKSLNHASLTIASSGTVTMECAWFRVPTVVLYKTSLITYTIGKFLIKVPYVAMPNILAEKEIFPEFIQNKATSDNIAKASLHILQDSIERQKILTGLEDIASQLGEPGATIRAAKAILQSIE
jgi:lipid-A-disaccharide synthase|tara:strand:+ start:1778 stop:2962 length:1185 start_codon:yes stop_codon:yes gene_type:complete